MNSLDSRIKKLESKVGKGIPWYRVTFADGTQKDMELIDFYLYRAKRECELVQPYVSFDCIMGKEGIKNFQHLIDELEEWKGK